MHVVSNVATRAAFAKATPHKPRGQKAAADKRKAAAAAVAASTCAKRNPPRNNNGVPRRADSCSVFFAYMCNRVRCKWREWGHIDAKDQVVN
jgi:hypothetical protein